MVMIKAGLFASFFLLTAVLHGQESRYMVFYKDKAGTTFSIDEPLAFLSQKAIDRREKLGILYSEQDLPVSASYVSDVNNTGAIVKYSSRWFNASLIEATASELSAVQALSCVASVEYVAPGKTGTGGRIRANSKLEGAASTEVSQNQNTVLGIDAMHADGYTGAGITIAVLDTGFPAVNTNPAFSEIFSEGRIKDSYNFAYGIPNAYMGHPHGAHVFSILAGKLSSFTGGAYDANFLLYATEYDPTEYRVEEYNWLLAAERADSAGADIISSSVGYVDFDDASMDYSQSDLDGQTAVITRAANMAFDRGIVVIVSAGNSGSDPWQLISPPADGENIIGVGSVTANFSKSSFSSIGPTADGRIKPDVMAIGSGTYYVNTSGVTTTGIGTSLACPQIASLFAGVQQMQPELTPNELINLIKESGTLFVNPNNTLGYGIPSYRAIRNKMDYPEIGSRISIYPNPVSDNFLRVAVSPPGEYVVTIRLKNLVGQLVGETQYDHDTNSWHIEPWVLDMTNLAPGHYLVEVSTENMFKTFRLIKQ
jgi:serine protease AprX